MNYLRDEIGNVVAKLRALPLEKKLWTNASNPNASIEPYFMYGHRLELNNRLKEKEKNDFKYKKYPLIVLRMDYDEDIENGFATGILNMAVLHSTNKNYNSEERDANVFHPVLFPLYEAFIAQIKKSGVFSWEGWQGRPDHKKTDRPYYGTDTEEQNLKNFFSDPLDAIEISNMKLSVRIKNC